MHLGYMIASSIVHGIIYDLIYKMLRHFGLGGSFLIAGIAISIVYMAMRRFGPHWSRY